ncbi:MAG: hypothetical protein GY780_01115 [bacterium]|nr:hypothetical protein [bacterium]
MSRFITAVFSRLVQMAGGRAEIVLPLYWALEKATEGQDEILKKQSKRRIFISSKVWRLLTLVASVLASTILSIFMITRPESIHPPLGVIVLVAVQYMVVSGLVLSQAAPGLLLDEDDKILGWWPLSQRELMLARISVLLRPALEVTAALSLAPLLVFLFLGNPPVLGALVFGVGLLLQAVGITFGITTTILLLVRFLGRRTASRLAVMVADGNHMMLIYPFIFAGEKIFPWLNAHRWSLYFLPPVWFASWGDLASGNNFRILAAIGLAWTWLVVWAGIRLSVSRQTTVKLKSVSSRPSKFSVSGLISLLLKPLMPGNEGWVMRKLLEAHIREDWRFMGSVISIPIMLLVFGLRTSPRVCPEDLVHSGIGSEPMVFMLMMMGGIALHFTHGSSTPQAMWLVAISDIQTSAVLKAQRGMVRGLVFIPALALYSFKVIKLGVALPIVFRDVLVLALEMDMLMIIFQPWMSKMPFSTKFRKSEGADRILLGFIVIVVSSVFSVANYFYDHVFFVRTGLWILLPALWIFFRWRLTQVMQNRRLECEAILQ